MSADSVPPRNGIFAQADVNLSNFVDVIAEKNPFAVAAMSKGKTASFAGLNSLVWKAVTRLEQACPEPGDIVGFRFKDQFLHLVFVLAALRSGIAHLSVFQEWPDQLSNEFVDQTGATVILGEDAWPESEAQTSIIDLPSLVGDPDPGDLPFREVQSDAPILFVLGSGTTGKPRIIYYDAANLTAMVERDLTVWPIGFQERYYSAVAFDFFTGKRRALGCLAAGGTIILQKRSASFPMMCDYLAIDHVALVVNYAEELVEKFKNNRPRLPRLKSLVVGGSPIREDLRDRLRESVSPNLFIGYGTNEIGEATFASANIQTSHPGTVGMPAPGVEIKIVDPNGDELSAGKTGEVLLRAKGMFSGYLNEPEATAAAFQGDWYRPGDLGSLTPDGALIFKGRSDDLMLRDGINIYPREIEQVLESHAGVFEAAAFPLHSPKNWQLPVAFVTLRDAALTEEILRIFCWNNLGPKLPEYIWTIEQMPRNAAGKILKGDLLKLAEKKMRQ